MTMRTGGEEKEEKEKNYKVFILFFLLRFPNMLRMIDKIERKSRVQASSEAGRPIRYFACTSYTHCLGHI